MSLIGYVCVLADDRSLSGQLNALHSVGCSVIHKEQLPIGNCARPVLAELLKQIDKDDSLVVDSIDRIADSTSQLLEIIEKLHAKGAFFYSIKEPIDTASPLGEYALNILKAAAQMEHFNWKEPDVVESTGIPSTMTGATIGKQKATGTASSKTSPPRKKVYRDRLAETADDWVSYVCKLRPNTPWDEVLRIVNASLSHEQRWTAARLQRAVRVYVWKGVLPQSVFGYSRLPKPDDRLPLIVAEIKSREPEITLQAICDRLESMRVQTPQGRTNWHPSTVSKQLDHARRLGLLPD